jgi:hypothetical protein
MKQSEIQYFNALTSRMRALIRLDVQRGTCPHQFKCETSETCLSAAHVTLEGAVLINER